MTVLGAGWVHPAPSVEASRAVGSNGVRIPHKLLTGAPWRKRAARRAVVGGLSAHSTSGWCGAALPDRWTGVQRHGTGCPGADRPPRPRAPGRPCTPCAPPGDPSRDPGRCPFVRQRQRELPGEMEHCVTRRVSRIRSRGVAVDRPPGLDQGMGPRGDWRLSSEGRPRPCPKTRRP